jgi:hypothetical protein
MQSTSWIALLQRIPASQHEKLAVVTSVGIEIAIQNIFRLEPDHLVIRGRLAGTTETGRVFFIPYDQLNYVGFQKEVPEALIREIYGEPEPAPEPNHRAEAKLETAPPAEVASAAPAAPPEPPEPKPALPPVLEPAKPEPRLAIPSRSGILARLRARSERAAKEAAAKPEP